jgi:hypothetical protein
MLPRQRADRVLEVRRGHGVGAALHVVARIDREEREAGGQAAVDVGGGLQVIGVGAVRVAPALLEGAPGGGVDDVLGLAAGARELAHGLLREDGRQRRPGGAQRADVTRGGEPEAVAEPDRSAQADRSRHEPRQPGAQRPRVCRAQRAQEQRPALDRGVPALEARGHGAGRQQRERAPHVGLHEGALHAVVDHQRAPHHDDAAKPRERRRAGAHEPGTVPPAVMSA